MATRSFLKTVTVFFSLGVLPAVPVFAQDICCDSVTSCSSWTVEVGTLGLYRARPSTEKLAQNLTVANEALFANQFEFHLEGGLEATARYRSPFGLQLEARYFGIDGWSNWVITPFSSGSIIDFAFFVQNTSQVTNVISSYSSEMQNAELNVRWPTEMLPDITWFVGYRYLQLDELILHHVVDPVGASTDTVFFDETTNRLHGGQLGFQWDAWCGESLHVDVLTKVGVFGKRCGANG